ALGAGGVPGEAEGDRRGGRGGPGGPPGHAYLLGHRTPAFRDGWFHPGGARRVVAAPSPAWKWTVNLPGTTGVAPSALSGPGMVPTMGGEPTPPCPRPAR